MIETMEIDRELIYDIILYKQNKLTTNASEIYDIQIKGISFNTEKIFVNFIRSPMIQSNYNPPTYDDTIIYIDEYKRLVREKKLKSIGI